MPQVYATVEHDPRRSVRRHHYQEGPGFLFLATQNGRPAGKAPKPSLNEVRRRMRAVRLAAELGIGAACSELGCSTASVYRWLLAFEKGGIEGLVPASRRPLRMRPTISGTSTSKVPSSSTSRAAATSRPGWSAWSTTTLDL